MGGTLAEGGNGATKLGRMSTSDANDLSSLLYFD